MYNVSKIVCSLTMVLALVVGVFAPRYAGAQVEQKRYTQLAVYPESNRIAAGETVDLVVEQIIAPHWHTYWKNPGDSGAAPVFTWDVPQGWSVSEILYPVPEKIPYGPLLNYGYSHSALMIQRISAPDDYDGSPLTINGSLEVLVCEDICIPEYEDVSVTFNDGAAVTHEDLVAQAYESQPKGADIPVRYGQKGDEFVLIADVSAMDVAGDIVDAYFIPEAWSAIINAEPPRFEIDRSRGEISIFQARGEQSFAELETMDLLLYLETRQDGRLVYDVAGRLDADLVPQAIEQAQDLSVATMTGDGFGASLLMVFVFAFLGGVILNLMPCVFPVLSMKTLSLVKLAAHHPSKARAHGVVYMLGVVISFVAVAGVLIALQAGGAQVGWGFQLQNPLIVAGLIYLLFMVGLNLAGVFEVGHGLSNVGQDLTRQKGLLGSFFTGVLATLVATPCTAPFMATAVGVALTQPAFVSLLIFAVLGFGLAFPYLVLAFVPALQQALPRPGAWMQSFQQALAFPMFLAVAWLLWVLSQQVGDAQLFSVFVGMVALSFAVWVWPKGGVFGRILAVLAFAGALYGMPVIANKVDQGAKYYEGSKDLKMGEEFSMPTLEYYLNKTHRPVMVEMTAAWCITCKINHASSIDVDQTRRVFADHDVAFLVGDWTNHDASISAYLHSFGRNGVPLYVFYPAPVEDGIRPEPVILPQILTPNIVADFVQATYEYEHE